MRITITTDDGEVVAVIGREEIGDLSTTMGRASLIEDIAQWADVAKKMEEKSHEQNIRH